MASLMSNCPTCGARVRVAATFTGDETYNSTGLVGKKMVGDPAQCDFCARAEGEKISQEVEDSLKEPEIFEPEEPAEAVPDVEPNDSMEDPAVKDEFAFMRTG